MPASRPSASFVPIAPDLDLDALVDDTPNFEYVVRIPCDKIEHQGLEAFEKLVLWHVIIGGKPLIVEGFQNVMDEWTFSSQWLRDNHGKKCWCLFTHQLSYLELIVGYIVEQARNLSKHQNMALSIGHYLDNMAKLTNQWDEQNYREPDRQRIYLKDIDCPEVWHDKLKQVLPPSVFYLNECTGEIGGPGSVDEPNSSGPGSRKGRGVGRAGDLMSSLPPAMRADNMMCYIGHEGTYTPAHREMCASLGQNIMVETSGTVDEHGKPTRPGSSIWFMTETKDRYLVSEYWLSTLGHDIEVEAHFAQINAWKAAPFKTYVVEQKVGDFILIPPLAPHQVWNRGTRTMKVAWNRTTVETLEMALDEALPRAKMVCRDEQYKNKAIIMFSLDKYSSLLRQLDLQKQTTGDEQTHIDLIYSPKIRQLQKDFKRLFRLYTEILLSEMLSPVAPTEKRGQYLPYDSYVTCSYCRCNIFNRFLTCTSCIIPLENGEEDTYDICMECFVMGRSCKCISKYKWVEQFPWQDLVQKHELWRQQIITADGGRVTEKTPMPLQVERKNMSKKTLAQVCQEQLKARPWSNPKKETPLQEDDSQDLEEVHVNADGTIRKKPKKSEKFLKETMTGHISQHREPRWKIAACQCGRGYEYGSLFRAFDLMPLRVMEDPNWQCPYCLKICSCGSCRKLPGMNPFEPKGTILGHDTRKVADPRSVESLVDFSHSNIGWIKKAGDDHPLETRRLRRRQDEAAQDKSTNPDLDDHYVNDDECIPISTPNDDTGIAYNMDINLPIDPLLRTEQDSMTSHSSFNGNLAATHESHHANKRLKLKIAPAASRNNQLDNGVQQHDSYVESGQPDQTAAPAAVMTNQDGIIYQYPDPTLPYLAPSPQKEQPNQPAITINRTEETNKRKRSQANNIIQSDFVVSPQNDANRQFHQAQIQRTLAEAKRNDRLISAEAAISGKSLRLKFLIDPFKLARIIDKNKSSQEALPTIDGGHEGNPKADTIIVQSDAPTGPQPHSHVNRSNETTKKRRVRVDDDEDFSTRKKPARKPMTARLSLPSDIQRLALSQQEISSESDGNASSDEGGERVEKTHQPRKLPAYLARRSDDVLIDPSADPYEALTLHRQRKKIPPKDKGPDHPNRRKSDAPLVREAVMLPSKANAQEPIDNFPAKPLPKPDASMDLSMLGPGETTTLHDAASRRAEENRKAKLKALQWAEAEEQDLDSETTSQDPDESDLITNTANPPQTTRHPTKPTSYSPKVVVKPPLTKRGARG